MKIGISGASGQLGAATLKYLQARVPAAQIVGISRTPDKVAALGVEARFGDFDQPESLAKAFAGLDRVLIIPTIDMRPGVRAVQNTTAITSAVKAGVEHVVFFSSLGTRAAEVPHLWETYFAPEQTLMRTAKKWTVLRMAYYTESLIQEAQMSLAGGAPLTGISSTPVNFVARDDLAAAAAGLLATGGHHGVIYQGTGPAALTGEERAAVIAKSAGKPLPFVQVTREQLQGGLKAAGLPDVIVDAVLSIQHMWSVGGFNVTTGDIELLSGRKPRTVAEAMAGAFS